MQDVEASPATAPAELRELRQWVVWRYEHRQPGKKATKVPYSPISGAHASTQDPSTWAGFSEAITAWQRDGFEGVGFVFFGSDPYCGIDLDDCLGEDGELSGEARRIVDRLATYTEISPSGRGLKLFLRGRLPGARRRKGNVEMYDRGRYFTVTGRRLSGTPTTLEDRQAELEELHEEIFGTGGSQPCSPRSVRTSPIASDEALLTKARAARNGRRFSALYDRGETGAHGGDDSAADLALCSHLAFWTAGDAARIDRLFRRSALMRAKWDERRGESTYGGITVQAALREPGAFYEIPAAPREAGMRTPNEWRELTEQASSGSQRRRSIASLAGHLLLKRVHPFVTLGLLRSWNLTACRPPLSDDEVARIVEAIAGCERQRRSGSA